MIPKRKIGLRRSEREITDRAEIDAVIRKCQVCRLAMVDGDVPYIVPMCFGYDGASFYFHCAPEGRKTEILAGNNRVCFELDAVEGLTDADEACRWGIRYQSVIGYGTARILADPNEKRKALTAVMAQYSGGEHSFPDDAVARTAAIEVRIESVTGKQSAR